MEIANVPDGLQTTGRYIVTLNDDSQDAGMAVLSERAGISRSNMMSSLDFGEGGVDMAQMPANGGIVLHNIGVAIVDTPPDAVGALEMAAADAGTPSIMAVEPEGLMYALDEPVNAGGGANVAAAFADTPTLTWGLQATKAGASAFTGAGIKVAILDTGLERNHPDFIGRTIVGRSFIPGVASFDDGHGHGTHCTGTACGSFAPPVPGRRYGVAHKALIYIGKVLSDGGSGTDGGILAGIDWAVANGCHVISMSLGANVKTTSIAYETAGTRALARGSLIIAAAGNNAHRPADKGFVGRPANSRTFMAVAALDPNLQIAWFSAGDTEQKPGTAVDIAGPGVAVYSSWLMPQRYNSIPGTSMATPHVAGIAALYAQKTGARGLALANHVLNAALGPGQLPVQDVGRGLVQAP
jgi:subtilisin family serine protease